MGALIRRGVVAVVFVLVWFWVTVLVASICWGNNVQWGPTLWAAFVVVGRWTAALTSTVGLIVVLDDLHSNAPQIEQHFAQRRLRKQEALQKRAQEQERLLKANGIDF